MKSFITGILSCATLLGSTSSFAADAAPLAKAECTYYQNTNHGEIKTELLEKGQPISFQVDEAHRMNKYTTVHIKMINRNEIAIITTSLDEETVFSSTSFQLGSGFEHYVNVKGNRNGFLNIKCIPKK